MGALSGLGENVFLSGPRKFVQARNCLETGEKAGVVRVVNACARDKQVRKIVVQKVKQQNRARFSKCVFFGKGANDQAQQWFLNEACVFRIFCFAQVALHASRPKVPRGPSRPPRPLPPPSCVRAPLGRPAEGGSYPPFVKIKF